MDTCRVVDCPQCRIAISPWLIYIYINPTNFINIYHCKFISITTTTTKMHSVKQKAADAAAVAKEHAQIYKAQAQEKAEKATATSHEEREIIHEKRKVKEAEAKMRMHEAKAEHAADKLHAAQHGLCAHGCQLQHQHHHQHEGYPLGSAPPTGAPAYPLGGYPPAGWTAPK